MSGARDPGKTILVNTVMAKFPFFALGALGIATVGVASGALRSTLRAEKLGKDRFELLR